MYESQFDIFVAAELRQPSQNLMSGHETGLISTCSHLYRRPTSSVPQQIQSPRWLPYLRTGPKCACTGEAAHLASGRWTAMPVGHYKHRNDTRSYFSILLPLPLLLS